MKYQKAKRIINQHERAVADVAEEQAKRDAAKEELARLSAMPESHKLELEELVAEEQAIGERLTALFARKAELEELLSEEPEGMKSARSLVAYHDVILKRSQAIVANLAPQLDEAVRVVAEVEAKDAATKAMIEKQVAHIEEQVRLGKVKLKDGATSPIPPGYTREQFINHMAKRARHGPKDLVALGKAFPSNRVDTMGNEALPEMTLVEQLTK